MSSTSRTPTALLQVRVTPGASRDALLGWQDDVLRLSVAAPAQRGKANEAALRLLATALGLPRERLRIVRGHTSRQKVIAIQGLDEAEVRARLDVAR
ncbi:MAG TPA: DUF167 domain-containing protein [Dehalococcoidia bacterium]|nr:DUF167 domain-containing protein [Dehalococcoidia bacterium]